jgi:hypothetical protein
MGARNAEPITDISIWHRGVRMIRPRILEKPLVYAGMSALRGIVLQNSKLSRRPIPPPVHEKGYSAIQCLVKSLRGSSVGNYISHMTPYIIFV